MYYIESEIRMTEGINELILGFHNINQLRIDYLNTEVEIQIASYPTKQEFKDKKPASKIVRFMIDYDVHDYNLDPNLFALRLLISQEGIFYKKEIKKVYDMDDPNW